jgi:hypothetical protein
MDVFDVVAAFCTSVETYWHADEPRRKCDHRVAQIRLLDFEQFRAAATMPIRGSQFTGAAFAWRARYLRAPAQDAPTRASSTI